MTEQIKPPIDPPYLAKRPGCRVVCRTLSAPTAWRVARAWAGRPGRWLASASL